MSGKVAIPTYNSGDLELARTLSAVKQNLDSITGQTKNADKLVPLPATASMGDVIEAVNKLIERVS